MNIGHKQLNKKAKHNAINNVLLALSKDQYISIINNADIASSNIWETGKALIALLRFQNNFFSFIFM